MLEKLYLSVARKLGLRSRGPIVRHDVSKWAGAAQEGELEFHKTNRWRETEAFMEQTVALFRTFGFQRSGWEGKTVIDLGAGSKLRSKFFEGARIVVIEPLADRYIAEVPWSDLKDAAAVFSRPAEKLVEECVGTADLLISINVLDHCYDFADIVSNIRDYLKPDGTAFLSFDMHENVDDMHPLVLTESVCEEIFDQAGLKVVKFSKGGGDVLQTYGHGDFCLNYWLEKADRA